MRTWKRNSGKKICFQGLVRRGHTILFGNLALGVEVWEGDADEDRTFWRGKFCRGPKRLAN